LFVAASMYPMEIRRTYGFGGGRSSHE